MTGLSALVRPGGVVAVEEVDWVSWVCEPAHPAWDRLRDALCEFRARQVSTSTWAGAYPGCCAAPGSTRRLPGCLSHLRPRRRRQPQSHAPGQLRQAPRCRTGGRWAGGSRRTCRPRERLGGPSRRSGHDHHLHPAVPGLGSAAITQLIDGTVARPDIGSRRPAYRPDWPDREGGTLLEVAKHGEHRRWLSSQTGPSLVKIGATWLSKAPGSGTA